MIGPGDRNTCLPTAFAQIPELNTIGRNLRDLFICASSSSRESYARSNSLLGRVAGHCVAGFSSVQFRTCTRQNHAHEYAHCHPYQSPHGHANHNAYAGGAQVKTS